MYQTIYRRKNHDDDNDDCDHHDDDNDDCDHDGTNANI